MNESLASSAGWAGGCPLSGFPILDNSGFWSEPKLPLLSVDSPTLIQVPYLDPLGPGRSLSCSAHTHIIKSSWAGSMNSGESWQCGATVKSLSYVIYCWELTFGFTYMPVMHQFPLGTPTINSPVWFRERLLILPGENNSWNQLGGDRSFFISATRSSTHLCCLDLKDSSLRSGPRWPDSAPGRYSSEKQAW